MCVCVCVCVCVHELTSALLVSASAATSYIYVHSCPFSMCMYVQIPAQHTYVMPTMILLRNWVKYKLLSAPAFHFWHMGYWVLIYETSTKQNKVTGNKWYSLIVIL